MIDDRALVCLSYIAAFPARLFFSPEIYIIFGNELKKFETFFYAYEVLGSQIVTFIVLEDFAHIFSSFNQLSPKNRV